MYLYFNQNGILKETINDKALRKGNVDSNVVYAYFEGNPEISTISFTFTRNGDIEPIILGQDDDSPIVASEDNIECFIPWDTQRKLKYFKYFTPYKFYKCTLNNEVLAVAGLLKMTILAINQLGEQVANGMFVGIVEDNNLEPTTEITYGQYQFILSELGRKVGFDALQDYQEKLIAGNNIEITEENEINVVDIEGQILHIDLSDSDYEITQEQIDILGENKLNYILLDGGRYNYANENVYVKVDTDTIKAILIDTSDLTWSEKEYELEQSDYEVVDISSSVNLGITNPIPQQIRAEMIATDKQLIFRVRGVGSAFSTPTTSLPLLSDFVLDSAIASKIKSLYNTRHICYGTSIVNFGGDYYQDIVQLAWSSALATDEVNIEYLTSHEISLEAKNITIDIRIVLDF